MLHQLNMKLITVSAAALSLGLAGCGGGEQQTSADETDASLQSSQDQNSDVADENVIDVTVVDEASVDATTAEAPIDYASLIGDQVKGKRVFVKCMSCHATAEGQNKLGPSLYNIVGSSAGTVEKFKYSPAMKDSGVIWDEEALHGYLENPKAFMPGNRMMFPGVAKAQDRADLIAFLRAATE